jgi:cell division protein ZapA (FtsZ GTPase activity inhibitor)
LKQVEVTILGQVYMLGCPEGGEKLLPPRWPRVDKEMGAIRDAGKVKARERIAVLAALNLAYQLAERAALWRRRVRRGRRPTQATIERCCAASTRRSATTASCCEPAATHGAHIGSRMTRPS